MLIHQLLIQAIDADTRDASSFLHKQGWDSASDRFSGMKSRNFE